MKRKILCLLLALTMINIGGLSVFASTPVDVYEEYLYLYETFEEDTIAADKASEKITFSGNGSSIEYVDGANGTLGAAHMKYTQEGSSINYKLKLVPNQEYKVSAWIKLNDISLVENELHFIYWSKMVDKGESTGYAKFMVENVGLKKNEWVKVSTVITGPEQVRIAGVGNYYVDTTSVGSLGIRFGDNGQFSNIEGYTTDTSLYHDFSIDDFIVEPLNDVTVDDTITLSDAWSTSFTKTDSTDAPTGFDSSICLTSKTGEYVGLTQKVSDMWLNRAYKISYWAKAELVDGASYGNASVVIYNNNAYTSKDTRIPKWPTYDLTASDGSSKLTDEWKYYEFVYYKGLNTFDERLDTDGNVEFRVYLGGSKSGNKVYMAGMNIEPLNMPYQDVINKNTAIDKTKATDAGWYYPVYSGIAKDDSVYSTGYKITNSANSISQYVQIKDNTKYKISFKAKAESYTNGSETVTVTKDNTLPIFILLDRTGDKPTPGSGTSTEDWTDNYGHETTPSYKWQYISGASLGKDDDWSAGDANNNKNWLLTNEWKEFSVIYEWDYLGNDYRMPLLSFRLGNDVTSPVAATWSIADVKIEEVTGAVAEVQNIELDGYVAKDSKVDISYDFAGATEGVSYVRILTGSDAAGWGTLAVVKASELKAGYTIPAEWVGKNLKIEVLPIQTDGTAGQARSISAGTVESYVYEFVPTFNAWTGNDISANVALKTISSFKSTDFKIIFATYKSDKSLSDVEIIPVTATGGMNTSQPISITDGEAVTAKIFILENNTLKPAIVAVPATKTAVN